MPEAHRPVVLMVGPLPPPLGGVQLMNDMLVRSSLASDFEIHTLNTSKNVLRWAVETPSVRTPFRFFRDACRLVLEMARVRPEVVYVHAASGYSFARDWAFMVLARAFGAKVVCHYHGTLHTVFPSVQTRSGRRFGRAMMRAANRIIVLSPGYASRMGEAWERRDIAWSPNLVDTARFDDSAGSERPAWLLPGERAVLFVGRLSAPKGFGDLLAAIPAVLARHAEVRFVLCGVAESDAREPELRADVEKRGFASRVTFLGSLEGPALAAAYAAASVFVSPSWTEAFPLVIPEAMAAGLPLVVTSVGAIPDFVREGEDGFLIQPRDAPALAERVNRLLEDEALRRRIADHVRERARREFAIEVGAARVRGVIDGLRAAGPPSG
jgi:glycosyltransferase involved in cell wall biosynthesis